MAEQRSITAVVCGAGPAGIVSAVALARKGIKVHIFERRSEEAATTAGPRSRTFPLSLNGRTLEALQYVGMLEHMKSVGPHANPRKAFGMNGRIIRSTVAADPMRRMFFVERLTLNKELVHAAKQQTFPQGGSIEWHFGLALEDVDFDAKTATFVPASAPDSAGPGARRVKLPYDLLVGADGAHSAVRAKMIEHKVPGLKARTQLSIPSVYKVSHGLPLTDEVEKTIPGISALQPGDGVFFFRRLTKEQRGLSIMWKQGDGTVSCLTTGPEEWWDDAELSRQLDITLYGGMAAWKPLVWAQISNEAGTQAPSSTSTITKLSQFHGPGTVLVGDAAHSVTPSLGQGCNCAFESAHVLGKTLDTVGLDRLDQLPQAYNAARIKDAHALQDMDYNMALVGAPFPVLLGPQRRPASTWQRLVATTEFVLPTLTVWPLLKFLAPRRFPEPTITFHLIPRPEWTYSQAKRLQDAVAYSTLAGGVAALGLGAWAAARVATAARR